MSEPEEHDGAATHGRRPRYRQHRFAVDVDGLPPLGFTEVDGLEVSVDSRQDSQRDTEAETEQGRWWDVRDTINRVAAAAGLNREASAPNLELRRAVGDDLVLWNWLQDWVDGRTGQRTVTVSLLDETGEATVGWVCEDARPVEWTGPTLDADRPGVAMEALELAHDDLTATEPSGTARPLAPLETEGPFLEDPR